MKIKNTKINLAIFASGKGSNADAICTYFRNHKDIKVRLIVSNQAKAGVLEVASSHGVESAVIPKSGWAEPTHALNLFDSKEITHIVLAGFLLLLPPWLIEKFNGHIINIHPALLPKYGGKGMYGQHVHEKVKSSGDLISGITIHEVNENYDDGKIIFQAKVDLVPEDSPSSIGNKVLQLEHYYYPRVIEKWVKICDSPLSGK